MIGLSFNKPDPDARPPLGQCWVCDEPDSADLLRIPAICSEECKAAWVRLLAIGGDSEPQRHETEWRPGDIAYDRTRFVWKRYELGWRNWTRTTGTQYGDTLLEEEAGPLTRLDVVPDGINRFGMLPADFMPPAKEGAA